MIPSSAVTGYTDNRVFLHAGAVEYQGKAILFIGRPGSGKSSNVISYIQQGGTLIADDYVCLERESDSIWVRPAEMIEGLLEQRNAGIARLPFSPRVLLSEIVLLDDKSSVPDWIGHCANIKVSHTVAS